jgi:internalin A
MSESAKHHFPTAFRLWECVVAVSTWFGRRRRAIARAVIATALVLGVLYGWREYLVGTQRDAVAAIERAGGNVSYDWEWRNGRPLPPGSKPPWPNWLIRALGRDLFGHVVAVWLGGRKGAADDALMTRVGRLERLEYLILFDTAVTNDGLAHLRGLTDLKKLYLHGTAVDGAGWVHLEKMVQLEELLLPDFPATDADVAHLAGLTRLRVLKLSGGRITDAGLARLGSMTYMEELSLRNTSITSLEPIRALTQLWQLDLVGSAIDDAGLGPLRECPKLELLWLGQTRVTDAGMAQLSAIPNLRILDLSRTGVGDTGFESICDLPRISYLNMYDTKVSDPGLAGVADKLSRTALRNLVVSGPRVTEAGIESLRKKAPGVNIPPVPSR